MKYCVRRQDEQNPVLFWYLSASMKLGVWTCLRSDAQLYSSLETAKECSKYVGGNAAVF